MIVLVVTACPVGLRGHLTRWLLEISPGVFVGRVTTRVRDLLWDRVVELAKDGRALLVFSAANEQRLDFKVHRHDWTPVDFDGVRLMMRPPIDQAPSVTPRTGWSRASQVRRARRGGGTDSTGGSRGSAGRPGASGGPDDGGPTGPK